MFKHVLFPAFLGDPPGELVRARVRLPLTRMQTRLRRLLRKKRAKLRCRWTFEEMPVETAA
jgi:hypothetical protein